MDIKAVAIRSNWANVEQTYWGSGALIGGFVLTTVDALGSLDVFENIVVPICNFDCEKLSSLPVQIDIFSSSKDQGSVYKSPSFIQDAYIAYIWTSEIIDQFWWNTRNFSAYDRLPSTFCLLSLSPSHLVDCHGYLVGTLCGILNHFQKPYISRGMDVIVESSPLGLINFNSLTNGVIANAICDGNLFTIDCSLMESSTGGPVFKKMLDGFNRAFGLVVRACSDRSHPASVFPMCVTIHHVLSEGLRHLDEAIISAPEDSSFDPTDEYDWVVWVERDNTGGTGVLVQDELVRGVIVTCGHVLGFMKGSLVEPVIVRARGETYVADVLYCADEGDLLDIAIVYVPELSGGVPLLTTPVIPGEKVYMLGRPLMGHEAGPLVVSRGIVAHHRHPHGPLTTTCALTEGCSGGAVVRPNRELIAIAVGRLCATPPFNPPRMARCVPAQLLVVPLMKYSSSGDVKELQCIQRVDPLYKRLWDYL